MPVKTIKLSSDQQAVVKRIYADLDKAQREFDVKWWQADKALVEIAVSLGLISLSGTTWGQDYSELLCR